MANGSNYEELGHTKRRAIVYLDGASLTRVCFELNPGMWLRTGSVMPASWHSEIVDAFQASADLLTEIGVEIGVAQVKSKLGSFRIYLNLSEDSAGPMKAFCSTLMSTWLRSPSPPSRIRERAAGIVDAGGKTLREPV